jgi:hypothetical protein
MRWPCLSGRGFASYASEKSTFSAGNGEESSKIWLGLCHLCDQNGPICSFLLVVYPLSVLFLLVNRFEQAIAVPGLRKAPEAGPNKAALRHLQRFWRSYDEHFETTIALSGAQAFPRYCSVNGSFLSASSPSNSRKLSSSKKSSGESSGNKPSSTASVLVH